MKEVLKNQTPSVERIDFDSSNNILIFLLDGRVVSVPLKYFPDLENLSEKERSKVTIVDDRTILFYHSDQIYHLEDFMGLEEKWRAR